MNCKLLTASAAAFLFSAAGIAAGDNEKPEFGAGEMLKPARTFYVSTRGNNKNDGTTPKTAWKTIEFGVKALRAGDTLLIDEGEYRTHEARVNTKDGTVGYSEQCGKPGSPIRIAGMPGKKVILRGSDYHRNPGKPVRGKIYQFKIKKAPAYDFVMENPSQVQLQRVYSEDAVMEYPGTFFLDESGKMLVHYAAENQDGIRTGRSRSGLRIQGSWILVENLTFTHYCEAVYLRMNMPAEKNAAEHITIRNCRFFHNYKEGLLVDGASFSLFTGITAMQNGDYGSIRMLSRAHDNLYTGNWLGPSPLTLRQSKPYVHNFALNQYGGGKKETTETVNNYVIGNVLEDKLSFRWKTQAANARFEDNMLYGSYYAESPVRPITIERNWFGGKIGQKGLGWDLWEKDFKGTVMVFRNNVRDRKDFKPENPIVFEAEKLRMELPEAKFPEAEMKDPQIKFITNDSAVAVWTTPECDGIGMAVCREKGKKAGKEVRSTRQGVRHEIGIGGLKPDTEYEIQLAFEGRRGQRAKSDWLTFRTEKTVREPKTLTVGPDEMTLNEAALAALPGDTVILKSGRHAGQFAPLRSGLPGKPITVKGEPGAEIDGQLFYNPLIDLTGKQHFIIDGISFVRAESTTRSGVIVVANGHHITVRNCRAVYPHGAGPMIRGNSQCSDITFTNNVSNGGDYSITLGGKNITVTHNTVVNSVLAAGHFWNSDNLTVTDNIFYRFCIPVKRNNALIFSNIAGKVVCDRNVFWSPFKEHPIGGVIRDQNAKVLKRSRTLKEWQELTGYDLNSLHADPLFENCEKGDFRLKTDSPAKGKGAVLP
ncbi:MAG: right-handed parallel beta-helix repeat-containing protein [Lentisphaeria bacterium]|nr:right-handed parallel beta-helix repeat-containing protein [Lentisphaeria bacterium]